MNHASKILFQSFVKPFYKENAGLLIFIFTMMFVVVSRLNGAGLFAYHYSLATGVLKNNNFLIVVFFAWLLYVRKFVVFASGVILNPRYAFLQVYSQLSPAKRFKLFFIVEVWLLLPVLLYVPFVSFVGLQQHLYLPVSFVVSYLLVL